MGRRYGSTPHDAGEPGGTGAQVIKVMVALQGKLYSEGIRSLLGFAGGMEVAAVADEGEELRLAQKITPDVVLTDTKTLIAAFPEGAPQGTRLIVIASEGEDLADHILNGTISGAIRDSSGPLTLETAIKAVSMGVVWMEGAWPKRQKGNARGYDPLLA